MQAPTGGLGSKAPHAIWVDYDPASGKIRAIMHDQPTSPPPAGVKREKLDNVGPMLLRQLELGRLIVRRSASHSVSPVTQSGFTGTRRRGSCCGG